MIGFQPEALLFNANCTTTHAHGCVVRGPYNELLREHLPQRPGTTSFPFKAPRSASIPR